jgi:hypothetical protein
MGGPNAGASGKANRIGAYRKSNNFDAIDSNERSTERRRRTQNIGIGKSPQMV